MHWDRMGNIDLDRSNEYNSALLGSSDAANIERERNRGESSKNTYSFNPLQKRKTNDFEYRCSRRDRLMTTKIT